MKWSGITNYYTKVIINLKYHLVNVIYCTCTVNNVNILYYLMELKAKEFLFRWEEEIITYLQMEKFLMLNSRRMVKLGYLM